MSYVILRPLINEDGQTYGYDVANIPTGVDVDTIIEKCTNMGAENISLNILHVEEYEELREDADWFDVWNQFRDTDIGSVLEDNPDLASAIADWYMA